MTLPAGTKVGTYEIAALLGAGGVGEVYRARDAKLKREVAIKILSDQLANAEARRRFQREAQMASSLNHPHIVTVHDVGEFEDRQYIVTEFVDGGTLQSWAKSEKRSWLQIVQLMAGVADGLACAHEVKILHRDIKPANILVSKNGYAKLADFGLAKITEDADLDLTLTEGRTASGLILGTIPYMSPEQASNQKLDARSDIFSFGIVLYELLAGRRPFAGATPLEVFSAIQSPAPSLPEEIPLALRLIVEKALETDPADRYQSMRELAIDLRRITRRKFAETSPSVLAAPRRSRPMWWIVSVGLALGVGIVTTLWLDRPMPSSQFKLTQLTLDDGLTTDPTLSPDGTLFAYASDRSGQENLDIYTQQIGGGAVRLTNFPGDESEPTFSPDARLIAFRSEQEGGGIYVVPALGGDVPRLIVTAGHRPRYSPDGKWIAYWEGNVASDFSRTAASRSYIVNAAGGTPLQIAPDFAVTRYPTWSPDGAHLLFLGARDTPGGPGWGGWEWWVIPVLGGKAVATGAASVISPPQTPGEQFPLEPAQWLRDGIIFSAVTGDSRSLWQVGISSGGQITEKPRQLTLSAGIQDFPSAAMGRIVFAGLNQNIDIWSLPIAPNEAKVSGPMQRLTQNTSTEVQPDISPDGRWLAFASNLNLSNVDVRLRDLQTGQETAVAFSSSNESHPVLSRDGSRLAHDVWTRGDQNIRVVNLRTPSKQNLPENLCADDCWLPWDWSPDGTKLLYWSRDQKKIGVMEVATRRKTMVLEHPEYTFLRAYFSPDQKWILFVTLPEPGTSELFVAPFHDAPVPKEQWIRVIRETGEIVPRWSPDGNSLYFASRRDGYHCLYTQRLEPMTKKPVGVPEAVQHLHSTRRSLSGVSIPFQEISVARDKIVFPMIERTGNIWMREPN
jgi:eukaryotic-like serine/threonine-protein kinase